MRDSALWNRLFVWVSVIGLYPDNSVSFCPEPKDRSLSVYKERMGFCILIGKSLSKIEPKRSGYRKTSVCLVHRSLPKESPVFYRSSGKDTDARVYRVSGLALVVEYCRYGKRYNTLDWKVHILMMFPYLFVIPDRSNRNSFPLPSTCWRYNLLSVSTMKIWLFS